MAFQVSPGVLVQELDLTRVIPAVSTSIGAFAGEFRQGPVEEIVTISSEADLVETFGKPDSSNFEEFFCAANFASKWNTCHMGMFILFVCKSFGTTENLIMMSRYHTIIAPCHIIIS